jgi:hypothetical protein
LICAVVGFIHGSICACFWRLYFVVALLVGGLIKSNAGVLFVADLLSVVGRWMAVDGDPDVR